MNDFLTAVALFGVASFILTFIYDGEFGDACEICLVGFGVLLGVGVVLRWVFGFNAADEGYLRSVFFGRATIVGWIYLVGVVTYAIVRFCKEAKEEVLWRKKQKCEMREKRPREYCEKYGHAEDDGTCACSVCRAIIYPERHRMRSGSCRCTICGEEVHRWDIVGDGYVELGRGNKFETYYECRVCGKKRRETRAWYPK